MLQAASVQSSAQLAAVFCSVAPFMVVSSSIDVGVGVDSCPAIYG
jgi:hypothetical protein